MRRAAVGWGWRRLGFGASVAALVSCAVPLLAQPPEGGANPDMAPVAALPVVSPEEALRRAGGPTLITLHLTNSSPQALVEELSKQSGLSLQGYSGRMRNEDGQTITFDADAEPFWQVVQRLLQDHGYGVNTYYPNGLALTPRAGSDNRMRGPSVHQGALHVVANTISTQVNLSRSLDVKSKTNVNESMQLGLGIFIDPRVYPILSTLTVTPVEARDEKGNSLVLEARQSYSPQMGARAMASYSVYLRYREDLGRRLNFRGTLRVNAALKTTDWVIPDITKAKDVARDFPAGRITVVSTGLTDEGGTVNFTVQFPQNQQIRTNSLDDMVGNIQLKDAKGVVFPRSNNYNPEWNERKITVRQTYRAPREAHGPPATLTFSILDEMARIEMPLEFKDLPLPSKADRADKTE